MNEQPIVTVVVYTYNSSEFVLETLDSIKQQTYQNLMLCISDDCSSDSTVELCTKWIEENKDRFIKTKLLTSDRNTGISANANRAWDACETEYIKDIAGDDLLLPNCIQDYVEYIQDNPDAVVVFGRVKSFYVNHGKEKWRIDPCHDYGFFELTPQEQYHYLFHKGNHLPAASCFYNICKLRELGFHHDERIPLLEDYPKWIIFARIGILFSFMNKYTVCYRYDERSLSKGLYSPQFFKSNLLVYLYYYQDEIKHEEERDYIYNLMCDEILKFYTNTYNTAIQLRESKSYRLGHLILSPVRCMVSRIQRLFSIHSY
jgi:alpha-1,3-rhamnosyltransferase